MKDRQIAAYNVTVRYLRGSGEITLEEGGPVAMGSDLADDTLGRIKGRAVRDIYDREGSYIVEVWGEREDIPEMRDRALKEMERYLTRQMDLVDSALRRVADFQQTGPVEGAPKPVGTS